MPVLTTFIYWLQIVSHDRKELEKILRAFNIYVDNPCCVLTQEESKKFIQGQEREKYDFFLKVNSNFFWPLTFFSMSLSILCSSSDTVFIIFTFPVFHFSVIFFY